MNGNANDSSQSPIQEYYLFTCLCLNVSHLYGVIFIPPKAMTSIWVQANSILNYALVFKKKKKGIIVLSCLSWSSSFVLCVWMYHTSTIWDWSNSQCERSCLLLQDQWDRESEVWRPGSPFADNARSRTLQLVARGGAELLWRSETNGLIRQLSL